MTTWGKRKDGQAYPKDSRRGIRSSCTNPIADVHMKTTEDHYKSTNGFLHKNSLEINVYDGKLKEKVDPEFLAEVRTAWNESPIETRNMVDRIVLKRVSSNNYEWEARWKRSTKTLTFINFPDTDIERVSAVVAHELAHIPYTEKQAANDPEILTYQKRTDLIEPVTEYARQWYNDWKKSENNFENNKDYFKTHKKEEKDAIREIQYFRNEYYNEQHSETAYLLDLYLKNYSGVLDTDKDNLAKAIRLYLQLHQYVKEPILKQLEVIKKTKKTKF